MADMHTPLKPCPFCGGEAIHCGSNEFNPRHWVMCRKCHACSQGDVADLSDAIAHWNRRAPSQDAETIKALRDELELAANRIEYAAIHMKIVTDQIAGGGDIPASINTWITRQLAKGQAEASEHAATTRAALAGSAS